jgi:pimeloyl-ACP methyl ester carboxylesterase
MEHIRSKDGTPIAYERSGQGPPLVLIHGAAADHTRWIPILQGLEKHFTVYAVDRRGRGQSRDIEPYTIEREYEDVAAVVDSISGPVNLLGHSYGALCCLEASLRTSSLRKLVLYEPPIATDVEKKNPPDAIKKMNSYLHDGEGEKALLFFLREIVGIPNKEINAMRLVPRWSFRVAAAHTIPREEASVDSYIFIAERFSNMETPTLLLLGGDSPPFFRATIETLNKSIPCSKIAILPRQGHSAMDTAPEQFVGKVIEFLTEKK